MKPVLQYDRKGNFIREYRSAEEAARATGVSDASNISRCCRGKHRSIGGFQWGYKYSLNEKDMENSNTKPVAQLDRSGRVVAIYESIGAASRATGFPEPNLCAAASGRLESCGGYGWKYATENTVVEAETGERAKRATPRLPFSYGSIRKDTDAALKAVALIKERIRGIKPVQSTERILRSLTGIEVGLDITEGRLTVRFDGGFCVYMKGQPLSDSFIVLLARVVLACNKVYENASVDYCGFFDGRWVDIVRVGNDLDGMIRERGL